MPRGRRPHKAALFVLEEDRAELLRWTKRPKSSNGLAQRARIILGCADGLASSEVAKALQVTNQTVCKWRLLNSVERCRRWISPMTSPVATLKAAKSEVMPCRR